MLIDIFASGSGGNSYLVSDGDTSLLLEAGLRESALKNMLWQKGYLMANLNGCLVSHIHKDHSASAAFLSKLGIPILASEVTLDGIGNIACRRVLESGRQDKFYTFDILPFSVEHDCPGSLGFLLQSRATKEKLLYATDTYYLRNKIPDVDYLMIEANYSLDILKAHVNAGDVNEALARRVIKSHMSIDHLIEALKAADLSKLREVYLMHLSNDNSNAEEFKRRIQEVTGTVVYVC